VRADELVALYVDMQDRGVPLWLVGGWGVDALLGRQTRDHDDLDVLVEVATLERLLRRLHDLGFERQHLWEETRWVLDPSWTGNEEQPTAFVHVHPDGRTIDVHVFRMDDEARVTLLWDALHQVTTEDLQGSGRVEGHPVRCMTAEMQRRAHSGYELTAAQEADMQLLVKAYPP